MVYQTFRVYRKY